MSSGGVGAQRRAKSNKTAQELAGACAINMLFTTICLVDYSADRWAVPHGAQTPLDAHAKGRLLWLGQFHAWRGEDPVVGTLMLILLLPLPLILIDFAIGAAQSLFGWRHASRTRHAADVLQACTMYFAIIPTVAFEVIGAQAALLADCSADTYGRSGKAAVEAQCLRSATDAFAAHRKMLGFNLLMFACDVAKYAGNCKEGEPSAALAPPKPDHKQKGA